jgi:CRISPR-associated endonuclease/helicase Cas3
MERATNKAERLLQIEALLLAHPDGLTQAEIARRLRVNRSTIHRYLPDLGRFCVYDTGDGRLAIDRDHYLTHVRLTLHEAMALHVASRLMATRTDKHNPHAASALRKLGLALERLAPLISQHLAASADVMDDEAQRYDPGYLQVLETLTQAWSQGRMVRLWHKHEPSGRVHEYDFAPYFIEPYAVGQTTHVIGWRKPPEAVRTFKMERIQRIELTAQSYTIPEDFDPRALLADAWGIWYTEAEPVQVVLRFHPRVVHRVQETRWHRQERTEEQTDGSLIWRARVAEPQEMLPWIRGWGADVEVLEPEKLRASLLNETRRLADLYGVQPIPTWQLLWAKTSRDKTETHPLICHLIDVAQVALALWNNALTEGIRAQFAETLALDVDAAGRVIAFWAGLHDLGKASPSFQRKYPPIRYVLERAGLSFGMQVGNPPCYHGTITARTLEPLLVQETTLESDWAYNVAVAVGGHHGDWPTPQDWDEHASPDDCGDEPWGQVRRDLFLKLKGILEPPDLTPPDLPTETTNGFFTLLSGLVSVADWLGSMEDYFEFASEYVDLKKYVQHAARQAGRALKEKGWSGWKPPTSAIAFEELCDVPSPRPLQEAVIELAPRLDRPALVIIEAPTGVGKTEAALYLADHWARVLQQRGTYVAMPTMATSNQMFKRVRKVLARRYPDELVNYHLLHGNALLMKGDQLPRLAKIEGEGSQGTVAALTWFTRRKRGLLAPFAVGTVDQALMSILQTPHFFVRLFGLSHKTIIFDEIHAYDTYMEELFYLLLRWLRVVGASVVILSATLPETSRRKLVQAYTGSKISLPQIEYPALTWTMGDQPQVVSLKAPAECQVNLEPISREPEIIARRLAEELREGGCAAVICNTVRRAQQVYEAIRNAKIVPEDDLILFHARFPHVWRIGIEENVLGQFGKQEEGENKRPDKAIVVATQVIEQSLDLDFDLMVSDLAPVDLIIQRIGRLHRHKRERRPAPVNKPHLLLVLPDLQDGLPVFSRGDVYVYGQYLLLRSFLVLREQSCILTPTDIQLLIESVYGPESRLPVIPEPFREALDKAQETMEQKQRKARREASSKLVPEPHKRDLLERPNACLEEDDPEMHKYRRAATRLAPPSITLICLHQMPHGMALDPQSHSPTVDISQKLDPETTRALFSRKIQVSDYRLVKHFADCSVPSTWEKNAWLRHARLVKFEGGVYCPQDEPWLLKLDRKLGLIVQSKEE